MARKPSMPEQKMLCKLELPEAFSRPQMRPICEFLNGDLFAPFEFDVRQLDSGCRTAGHQQRPVCREQGSRPGGCLRARMRYRLA